MKTLTGQFVSADGVEFTFSADLDARSHDAFAVVGGWIEGPDKMRTEIQPRACHWSSLQPSGYPGQASFRAALVDWVERGDV